MIIGSKLLFFKNLPSTNSFAASMLRDNDMSEGTIVRTDFQSAGRGQGGNKWESEDNKNLLISIILFPSMIHPADQFILSMTVSLGIYDFLKQYTPGISIKWPNDIYVNNDKIAGILIENSIMGDIIDLTIAGIGININQEIFISTAPNPVSLANLTAKQYDLTACLNSLTTNLDKRYKALISGDIDLLKRDYRSLLYRKEQWCKYRDKNGIFTGRIVNVSDSGRIIVDRADGAVNEYAFKEVEFIL
jgi:BirA family biotin operon repressor/biotin-[acetyl-CoA-carboxylase] ligase